MIIWEMLAVQYIKVVLLLYFSQSILHFHKTVLYKP